MTNYYPLSHCCIHGGQAKVTDNQIVLVRVIEVRPRESAEKRKQVQDEKLRRQEREVFSQQGVVSME